MEWCVLIGSRLNGRQRSRDRQLTQRGDTTISEPAQPQNMIRQLSRDTTLPVLENTHKRASNDHKTSIKRLVQAIAGIASQQQPTTPAIPKPASTNTLMFDQKNEQFELFEDLLHAMLRLQPEEIKAKKNKHFSRAFEVRSIKNIFRNINATNKRTLGDVLIVSKL